MTLRELQQNISTELATIYEPGEANKITALLLENVTGKKTSDFSTRVPFVLSSTQVENILQAKNRLLTGEPIQYVLNETWFFGMKFFINNQVLIPRPETEELVDWIISNLKFPLSDLSILDIGTGSGCIAIALKRKLRKAGVWACDMSYDALQVAKQNSQSLQADIKLLQLDFLNRSDWEQLPVFDIIVSNPPYVPEMDKMSMHKNVLHFEPHLALFVKDNDPLVFYKAIAEFAQLHLSAAGYLYCEIHENLGKEVQQLFTENGFLPEIKKDMQGKDRMVKALRRI